MSSENEVVVDYGVEDGIPFVLTEIRANDGNNIPRHKYVGDKIPETFLSEIRRNQGELVKKEVDTTNFDTFQGAINNPREDYTEGFKSPFNKLAKEQKGEQNTDTLDNLHPERFKQNLAEDVQINATDTYQEIKPPDNIEEQNPGDKSSMALDELLNRR